VRGLEKKLAYRFRNQDLLVQALTHRSYLHEHRDRNLEDNDRLEFLGDSVVELAVSHLLMFRLPAATEGRLSKMRAGLVNKGTLASVARDLGLGEHLRLGAGEARSGGNDKDSILADALEAVLGAVYLDGGYARAFRVVETLYRTAMAGLEGHHDYDYKTRLQEYSQRWRGSVPDYRVLRSQGPDHDRYFHVQVSVDGQVRGEGTGRSIKEAEQRAAQHALEQFPGEDDG
jgi:ribonuclease-3